MLKIVLILTRNCLTKIYPTIKLQKSYCMVNSVLYDFKNIPCDVKSRLLDTYC